MNLCAGGNDVTQQRLGALDIDGEIIVNEKDGNLPLFSRARAFNSNSSFTTLSLVRKRMESPLRSPLAASEP
jgi:hypothetical protein